MALMDKYGDLFKLANQIGLKNPDVKEEAGKLKISGQTEYQLDANRLWDNIKTHQGWENEIVANIKAQRSDGQLLLREDLCGAGRLQDARASRFADGNPLPRACQITCCRL